MHKIKSILNLRILFLFFFLSSTVSMVFPSVVSAAAPVCYGKAINIVETKAIDCKNLASIFQAIYGHDMQDDHCYVELEFDVRELGLSETIPDTDPLKGYECSKLAGYSAEAATKPPGCFAFNEDTLAKYFSLEFIPGAITTTPCTPELAARIKAHDASFNDFQSFRCYLFSKTEDTAPDCSTLIAFLNASAQKQESDTNKAITNPDRKAALDCDTPEKCIAVNPLVNDIKLAINVFSALFGIIVTGVIIWGGFTYARAGGDPNTTAEAKKRIRNAIMALAMYIFLYALMQWLIPGGPF